MADAADRAYEAAYQADAQHEGNKRATVLRAARRAERAAKDAEAVMAEYPAIARRDARYADAAQKARESVAIARAVAARCEA